jgi:alpha-galactosidase
MAATSVPEPIVIDAGATVLALGVGDDGRLHQVGFGGPDTERQPAFPMVMYPLAFPTHGEEPLREPALRITHADGVASTRLVFRSHQSTDHADGVEHRVELVDRVAPVAVTLAYRTWPEHGILEQWIEVANEGDATATVHRFASSSPAFGAVDAHLTHWGGGWAHEWTETTEALHPGTKTIASAGGVRPSLYRPPVVLVHPDGRASETEGTVALATVAWGGDVRFEAEIALHGQLRVLAGVQHRGAERKLDGGERLITPSVAWCWSDHGVGATSRALHRFTRDHILRDGHGPRAIVANTWEAVGFGFDEASLIEQVDAAAATGAELFLLDDGWFGTTHPRDDDTTSLGDWDVDPRKLPRGLQPVIDHTIERGLRFGLWIEPEMVNPTSDLYTAHPDWVVAEAGRERREERQQLILDLCQPTVARWCVDRIDAILGDHQGITYLKWDANRDVTEPGSSSLPADRQSHLALDRVRATMAIMATVAERHPEVELMLCASGGGRSDLATLAHFHELWTSDNTDPVDRVRIQWGASHLLPASVLAAHVTRWGQRPFAFAAAVALSGRFGFDVDLITATPEEREIAAASSDTSRRIRHLVQQGDLHRLVSPIASEVAALAYVDDEADADAPIAAVFAFVLDDCDARADRAPVDLSFLGDGPFEVVDATPGRGDGGATPLGADRSMPWPHGPAPVATIWLVRRAAD